MKAEMKIAPMSDWIKPKNDILVISGPCSAETEDQLVATANLLAQTGKVDVLRAGIWKPRTRPGEFEGIGKEGLAWMQRAKKETGLPITVEVATAKHVEESLEAGVDILWIGARSTVNPFTVQEIADAVRGVDIPVLIKNPINPDLALWMGAIERFSRVGITKLGAIHRGFSAFEKSAFRNEPMWDLAISLRTQLPNLPIICDPSHICGNRELIPYISQTALDLDMQGLIVESHIDPSKAWTDAKQQITPQTLDEMLGKLTVRKNEAKAPDAVDKLAELRKQIDTLDDALIQKVAERMSLVRKIGEYKKNNNVTVFQINRWEEILQKRRAYAKVLNLEEQFVEKMFEMIHAESVKIQSEIMESNSAK